MKERSVFSCRVATARRSVNLNQQRSTRVRLSWIQRGQAGGASFGLPDARRLQMSMWKACEAQPRLAGRTELHDQRWQFVPLSICQNIMVGVIRYASGSGIDLKGKQTLEIWM